MVAKAKDPTWVAKVELKTSPSDRRRLNSAVEATRLAYNASVLMFNRCRHINSPTKPHRNGEVQSSFQFLPSFSSNPTASDLANFCKSLLSGRDSDASKPKYLAVPNARVVILVCDGGQRRQKIPQPPAA